MNKWNEKTDRTMLSHDMSIFYSFYTSSWIHNSAPRTCWKWHKQRLWCTERTGPKLNKLRKILKAINSKRTNKLGFFAKDVTLQLAVSKLYLNCLEYIK